MSSPPLQQCSLSKTSKIRGDDCFATRHYQDAEHWNQAPDSSGKFPPYSRYRYWGSNQEEEEQEGTSEWCAEYAGRNSPRILSDNILGFVLLEFYNWALFSREVQFIWFWLVASSSRKDFGKTQKGLLGWLVHARSGDKGSNANVGFWARHKDEYDWMRTLLSTEKMKQLLGKEYKGGRIVCNWVPW
jgi:hypothetical protein